ncbi:hypothetical protein [Ideonella sp.]|uniref:hypothetical protein n=1 Tax=Ideonella sp. TaxID=1929293 RepID=UPI003BB5BC5A
MTFVFEQPDQVAARAWFAYYDDEFLRKVCAQDRLAEWCVFDLATPRELLDITDRTPDSPGARSACPTLCALADDHG